MFQVDKNVPLAVEKREIGARPKYPLAKLDIGDSFFVPSDVQRAKIVRNTATSYAKRHGKEFRVLKVDGGCRCWRTA